MNAARYFLPHILALSVNSPFWLGHDSYTSSTHIDVVGTRFTIQLDGQVIMRDGSFTLV